jgi:hypothetical protein
MLGRVATNRSGQGPVYRPAGIEPLGQGRFLDPQELGPLGESPGLAVVGQDDFIGPGSPGLPLLRPCGPSAIASVIALIRVQPVDCVSLGRPLPHVFEEEPITILPSVAYRNRASLPATVILE